LTSGGARSAAPERAALIDEAQPLMLPDIADDGRLKSPIRSD